MAGLLFYPVTNRHTDTDWRGVCAKKGRWRFPAIAEGATIHHPSKQEKR